MKYRSSLVRHITNIHQHDATTEQQLPQLQLQPQTQPQQLLQQQQQLVLLSQQQQQQLPQQLPQQLSQQLPQQPLPQQNSVTTTTTTFLSERPPDISSNPGITSEHRYVSQRNKEFFDIRLKENFKIFISGPSRSGKTVFIKNLLQKLSIFSKSPPKLVTLVYKIYQPIYDELNLSYIMEDTPGLKEKLINLSNGEPMLIIFDDCINSLQLSEISDFFLVDGRHRKLSCIFISQKIFINNDNFREISQNSDYFVIFKNPRNIQEIRMLNGQMSPTGNELLSYYKLATSDPFSYLFINLTQECKNEVKYLSHVFNDIHRVTAYLNNTSKKLTDGENDGFTHYNKMYFDNGYHPSMGTPRNVGKDDVPSTHDKGVNSVDTQDIGTDAINGLSEAVQTNQVSTRSTNIQTDVPSTQDKGVNSVDTQDIGTEDISVGTNVDGTHSEAMTNVVIPYRTQETSAETFTPYRLQALEHFSADGTQQKAIENDSRDDMIDSSSSQQDISTTPSETYIPYRSQAIEYSPDIPFVINSGDTDIPEQDVKRKRGGLKDNMNKRNKRNIQPYSLYRTIPGIQLPRNTERNRFRCEICYITTRSERGLKNHMRVVHRLKDYIRTKHVYKCNICRNIFQTVNALKSHISSCNTPVMAKKKQKLSHNVLKCRICGTNFQSKDKLKLHHQSCKDRVYVCTICGRTWKLLSSLKNHMKTIHGDGKQ